MRGLEDAEERVAALGAEGVEGARRPWRSRWVLGLGGRVG